MSKCCKFWLAQIQEYCYQFRTVQIQQNDQFENARICNHGDTRNVKFGHRQTSLKGFHKGSLPDIHVNLTSAFIWAVNTTPWWSTSLLEVVTSLPFDHMTLINLYISSYKEVPGATSYTQMFKASWTSFFKHFVIIKFSKSFRKQKCCHGSWTNCRILYLYLKQVNWSKCILSTNFLFFLFFSNTKLNS